MRIKTRFSGYREVQFENALSWALNIWTGASSMTDEQRLAYIAEHIEGHVFTKEELTNECNKRRQGNRQSVGSFSKRAANS